MSFDQHHQKQSLYRLALVSPRSQQMLAERHGGSMLLPCIEIPLQTRPAEQLTNAIRRKWNLNTIVIDFLPARENLPTCAVCEILTSDFPAFPDELAAVDPGKMAACDFLESERAIVSEMCLGNTNGRGAFSRLGWIEEARQWIRESVSGHAIDFTNDIHQLNAGGPFALVRLGTRQGPAYWLKATGYLNQHEFSITTALARYLPEHLPPLVAAREDWNAWVTEEFGCPLTECLALPALEQVVLSLADLQMRSICCTESLLGAGCLYRGVSVLERNLEELMDYIGEAMALQISTKAPRLEPVQLRELSLLLKHACSQMQDLGIPDSLLPIDLNPGNILVDSRRCAFIDWAETYIANPFLAFEHFLAHVTRREERTEAWTPHLRTLYTQQWHDLLSGSAIDAAFAVAPLLAVGTYLYGRGDWLRSPRRNDPNFQAYARSLARHMYRATHAQEAAEAVCP